MKKSEYINNAKILHSLQDLPQIGSAFLIGERVKAICYSLEAFEDEAYPDYIFYRAHFSERLTPQEKKYFIFGVDSFIYTYAIKIDEF